MKKLWLKILCWAWPPYRVKLERDRAWHRVFSAGVSLLRHHDWDQGDFEAGKILSQKMKELGS